MGRKQIDRRQFLASAATAAGIVFPGVAWSAGRPCPPPGLGVVGGTTATTSCPRPGERGLPKLTLVTRAADGLHPWTFGQAFGVGDVPSGSTLTGQGDPIQVDVRNRWPDGSLKFAVLSGITPLVRNSAKSIALRTSAAGGESESPHVPEPTSLDVQITFSGDVTGTYRLQSALGVNKDPWGGRSGAGRVRSITGPVMSEFHYYVPTSDDHVAVWFYVRHYANGATEIETAVENGWMLVPMPGARDYTVALSIAGTTRYSGILSHLHHTRWSRVDWVGTDPQVVPAHDGEYLKTTGLVPNYASGYGPPDESVWSKYVQTATPMGLGNWRSAWDGTGDGDYDQIGLLPPWDVIYLQSGDARGYATSIANARMAGSLPAHYRDEATGRPFRFSDHATRSTGTGMPRASGEFLGGISESTNVSSHSAGFAYVPYLITGRWLFLEECQHWAGRQHLERNPVVRSGALGLWHIWNSDNSQAQTRSLAWGLRQLALAACITPDEGSMADTAHRAEYVGSVDANLQAIWASSVQTGATHENAIGMIRTRPSYSASGGPFREASWQLDFLACTLGWITDLRVSASAYLSPVRDQLYRFAVGRAGGHGGGYNWRNISSYTTTVASSTPPSSDTYFGSFEQVYAATITSPPAPGDTLVEPNTSNELSPGRLTFGYAAHAIATLAFAVDHGAAGAKDALTRIQGSSTWKKYAPQRRNFPKWAIDPRAV